MLVRVILLVVGASLALAQEFPPVKDWKSVRITLERTSCFGSCPAYNVEIRDGVVRFRGVFATNALGEYTGDITRAELQQLVDEFRRADYMKLGSEYFGPLLDAPSAKIFVSIDGTSKTIADYTSADGVEHMMLINGEPAIAIPDPSARKAEIAAVKALEKAIDSLAHTDKWVKGRMTSIPLPPGRKGKR